MIRAIHPIVAEFRMQRIVAGLTQRDMANRLSVDWSSIRDFERGRCDMGLVKLERRFAALGMELAVVPSDPAQRAQEAADWLRAQGWKVEGP